MTTPLARLVATRLNEGPAVKRLFIWRIYFAMRKHRPDASVSLIRPVLK